MTDPTTVLLDGENLFRGAVPYSSQHTLALFDQLLTAIEVADARVEFLRCYGKAEDPAIRQLMQRIPTRPHWVLVLVAKGPDVADNVLCFDLERMSQSSNQAGFVVGSSDKKVLSGSEEVRSSGAQVRVVLKGRHDEKSCHIGRYPSLVDDHVHICDLLRTSIKSRKQAGGKANVSSPARLARKQAGGEANASSPARFAALDDLNRAVSQLKQNAVSPALADWCAPLRQAASYPELFDARMKLCDEIDAAPLESQAEMWNALDAVWAISRRRLLEAEGFSGDSAHDSG
jgi:hypothetical protein